MQQFNGKAHTFNKLKLHKTVFSRPICHCLCKFISISNPLSNSFIFWCQFKPPIMYVLNICAACTKNMMLVPHFDLWLIYRIFWSIFAIWKYSQKFTNTLNVDVADPVNCNFYPVKTNTSVSEILSLSLFLLGYTSNWIWQRNFIKQQVYKHMTYCLFIYYIYI